MTEPSTARPAERPRAVAGLCLLLAVAVLAVYWPATHCGFVDYDDPDYVSHNPQVLHGLTGPGIAWAFTTNHADNWHPLTWLSLMVDAQFLGPGAAGFHLINVLLHTANTVVLFLLLRQLTGTRWRSLLVAGWFGLHPLHVESVAWISERKDVLSTLFGLLTLWMYGLSVQPTHCAGARTRFRILALFFFVLGLLSKPMLVTLPFVMLLLDYWPLRRTGLRPLLRGKTVFLLLAAGSCVITYLVQNHTGAVQTFDAFPAGQRVANAFVAVALYLRNTFWPDQLTCLYLHHGNWSSSQVASSVLLVIGLSASALYVGRRVRLVFTGWFWFLGMLVPVIGLVQVGVQSLADRYTYLPLIGIFLILAWGAAWVAARSRLATGFVTLACGVSLAACGLRARDQLQYWQNSETLFRHACEVTPENYIALNNLGLCLFNQGRVDEAIDCYQQAVRANPAHVKSYNNLGNAYARRGDSPTASHWFEEALRINPNVPDPHYNYGNLLVKLHRLPEAIDQYQRARELAPGNATIGNNLGLALALAGRTDDAIASYRQALAIKPDYVEALANLGGALLVQKNYPEAATCYEAAVRLEPERVEFHNLLGNTWAAMGRWSDAATEYRAALGLDVGNAKTHFRLGLVLLQLGESEQAVRELREAVRLQPDFPEALAALHQLDAPVVK